MTNSVVKLADLRRETEHLQEYENWYDEKNFENNRDLIWTRRLIGSINNIYHNTRYSLKSVIHRQYVESKAQLLKLLYRHQQVLRWNVREFYFSSSRSFLTILSTFKRWEKEVKKQSCDRIYIRSHKAISVEK